jgi:hypothetical protein
MNFRFIPAVVLFLLAGMVWIVSCKKQEPETVDLGLNYFPDRVGSYVELEVDSMVQDDNLPFDSTYKYRLKIVVAGTFTDNSGRPSLRIERFRKKFNPNIPYAQMSWVLSDVWYATRTLTGLEQVEENVKFHKLVFPPRKSETWNGNAYNVFEAWPYKYKTVHVRETINNFSFDSVITVQQINQENIVEHKFSIEKYAKGIGLVYKEYALYQTNQADSTDTPPYDDTLGLGLIPAYWYYPDKAVFYKARIVSWGN